MTGSARSASPRLSAGVITADLTRLGAELEHLRGTDLILVLAVNPGWPGQAPAANTYRRVHDVHELAKDAGADVLVGVDGG